MRRTFVFLLFVFAASALHAQNWVVIDGVPATPVRLSGSINPPVQKLAAGFYKVTLPQVSRWVLATSTTGGSGGDATPTLASVRYDTSNPRIIYVTIYGVGSAGAATVLKAIDGRFSLEVRNGS